MGQRTAGPHRALRRPDSALGGDARALAAQRAKLGDPDATPSARLLRELVDGGVSFHDYSLDLSRKHAETLRAQPLPADGRRL